MATEDDVLKGYDPTQVALMSEVCIAVDEADNVIGPTEKKECHLIYNINKGLVHRAFSVLIFNDKNEFLLSQRSEEKITFPGFYTNACCSHPLYTPLEMETKGAIGVKRAAQRRLKQELGIEIYQVPLCDLYYLKRMLYKAASSDIWGEAEIDYILILRKNVDLKPNSNEVKSLKYFSKSELSKFLSNMENMNILNIEFFLFLIGSGVKVTPWFQIMVDQFLFDWWDNLDNITKFENHKEIFTVK